MTFDDFWAAYPRRKGSNPKHPASLKFSSSVKNGADPSHIVSSAIKYKNALVEQGKDNTEFVCMAVTWLNQKRWMDYAPDTCLTLENAIKTNEYMASKGYKWNGERWEQTNGSTTHAD